MTDKEMIKKLFDIFFRLEDEDEAITQSYTIRNTLEKIGFYEKSNTSSRVQHTKSFDNYIDTLQMKPKNPNYFHAQNVLEECLLILE